VAIAFRASSTPAFLTATTAIVIPTAQLTGDIMFLVASGKPYNSTTTCTTSGWASLGRGESGTTAAGIDIGSMMTEIWWKVAESDTETNPTLTEGATAWNVMAGWIIVFSKGAGETWETPVVRYGGDETDGTSISINFGTDPGGAVNDFILAGLGTNSDALSPMATDMALSWTGITFGAAIGAGEWESATGGDMGFHANAWPVTAGPSSAAPTATATGTTSSGNIDRVEAFLVRMRVAAAASQTLTGTLFTKQPTFPVGILTSTYTLAGTLFTKTPTFPTGGLSGTYTLGGSTFQRTGTFPQGSLTQDGGSQTLTGTTFQRAPTFPQGSLTSVKTLTGTTFQRAPTFPTGGLTAGAVTLSGATFQRAGTFPVGSLTQPGEGGGDNYERHRDTMRRWALR
jgi:hypothetical protein